MNKEPLVYPAWRTGKKNPLTKRIRITEKRKSGKLVGAIGLEPTTPTMSRWCSNQLSYAPESLFEGEL